MPFFKRPEPERVPRETFAQWASYLIRQTVGTDWASARMYVDVKFNAATELWEVHAPITEVAQENRLKTLLRFDSRDKVFNNVEYKPGVGFTATSGYYSEAREIASEIESIFRSAIKNVYDHVDTCKRNNI